MGVLLCFQQQAVGLHTLVGCTTDRELHPAPKVFIYLLRLYPAEHKLRNSLAPPAIAQHPGSVAEWEDR